MRSSLLIALALQAAAAAPAYAQASTSFGAQGGVFGGQSTRPARHAVDFTLTGEGAYDSDNQDLRALGGGAGTVIGGYSTLLMGNAEYKLRRPRFELGATGNGVWRRYQEQPDLRKGSYSAGLGFSASPSPRTTLTANQSVAYAPSYLAGLFPSAEGSTPGDAPPLQPNYSIHDTASTSFGTSVGLSQGLSRRSTLALDAALTRTNYQDQGLGLPDLDDRTANATYAHHLSKNLSATVGYRYRNGTFGYALGNANADVRTTEQGTDVGLSYTRPLSATRNLDLAVSGGGSRMTVPEGYLSIANGERPADAEGNETLTRFSGSASATWEFSTTWSVSGAARRGAEFLATLGEPVYVDSASLGLSGLLSSRVGLSVSGGYSTGQSALNRNALVFDTYNADTQVQVALSRRIAAYGQFFYYHYAFDEDSRAPLGIPRGLDRTGVRAGLTFWVPAFRR